MATIMLEIVAAFAVLDLVIILAACGMAGLCAADEERAGVARRS